MDIKEKILDIAQRLIQERGVNGFSYADIAKEIGIAKPSLHHHFATKTDLVARLLERYTEALIDYLEAEKNKPTTALEKIGSYCALYQHSLTSGRVCMGGMLSAELLTLDASIHPGLERFFSYQLDWLKNTLENGKLSGELKLVNTAEEHANIIISSLQGGLVISRTKQGNSFFEQTVSGLLSTLKP